MKRPGDVTLLIVDDETDLCEIVAHVFQRKGFNVLTASTGNEAYEIIKTRTVDLVLSDIQMPNGNGVEMLDKIKKEYPSLPIVMFMTGYTNVSEQELYKKGASAIFMKPFNQKEVLKAVVEAVGLTEPLN